jgi:simple sugar transport system permease protein/ribose transport system permease protein
MQGRGFDLVRKRRDIGAIIGAVVLFVLFSALDPENWLSSITLRNVAHFTAILGLIAIGQGLVIISREIDLSVGSVYGLVAIAFISLEAYVGVLGSFAAAMLLAALIGYVNALLVLRGRLVSMIVTLGALFFYRGVIYVTTGGTTRSFPKEAQEHWFTTTLGGQWLGFENAVLWFLLLAVVFSAVLTRTRYGNQLQAAGGDQASALSQGVDIVRVKTVGFVACSSLAGLAGIMTVADRPQTHVTLGTEMELEAISAAVIGGCVLSGGRGSVLGAVLGAFIITSARYELIALGAPSSWFITFVGILLIAAVIANQALAGWLERA